MKLRSSALLVLLFSLWAPLMAQAHVKLLTSPVYAGTTQELIFTIEHGCSGTDTVSLQVRIPDGVTSVRGQDAVWGKAVVVKDATSGNVTSVTWSKTDALPADVLFYRVSISAKLPASPFTPVYFPAVQTCQAADGTQTTVEWTSLTTDGEPAPMAFLLPARTPGWNKFTVGQHLTDLTVFKDAQIVWAGSAAYSANPVVMSLISQEPNTQVLSDIAAGTDIWVKY